MTDFLWNNLHNENCRSISRFSFDCLLRNNMQSEAIEVNVGEACFPFYTSLFLIFVLLFMITTATIYLRFGEEKYATWTNPFLERARSKAMSNVWWGWKIGMYLSRFDGSHLLPLVLGVCDPTFVLEATTTTNKFTAHHLVMLPANDRHFFKLRSEEVAMNRSIQTSVQRSYQIS